METQTNGMLSFIEAVNKKRGTGRKPSQKKWPRRRSHRVSKREDVARPVEVLRAGLQMDDTWGTRPVNGRRGKRKTQKRRWSMPGDYDGTQKLYIAKIILP